MLFDLVSANCSFFLISSVYHLVDAAEKGDKEFSCIFFSVYVIVTALPLSHELYEFPRVDDYITGWSLVLLTKEAGLREEDLH